MVWQLKVHVFEVFWPMLVVKVLLQSGHYVMIFYRISDVQKLLRYYTFFEQVGHFRPVVSLRSTLSYFQISCLWHICRFSSIFIDLRLWEILSLHWTCSWLDLFSYPSSWSSYLLYVNFGTYLLLSHFLTFLICRKGAFLFTLGMGWTIFFLLYISRGSSLWKTFLEFEIREGYFFLLLEKFILLILFNDFEFCINGWLFVNSASFIIYGSFTVDI